MDILQITSILIVLAGLFGTLNHLYLRLPSAIGILVVSLLASFMILGVDLAVPDLGIGPSVRNTVMGIDFSDALLEGMLGLLLFAGALHVSLEKLRAQALPVLLMATIGVGLSTLIAGTAFSLLTGMPLLIAMVFGALISPTDPVAVLGVLREANLRSSLETKIAGESLFNDGVGYVVYLILVALAFPAAESHATTIADAGLLFVQEALGGALLGAILGWLTFQLMKRIDEYSLEVLLTLGLAFGGYSLSLALHVSAPIMAVVAGLFIGHVGTRYGMSEITRTYVDGFWKLIDEILNAVLFLLIGVEVFAVAFSAEILTAGAAAIGIALLARLAAVAVPVLMLRPFRRQERDVIPVMTWGGLKGGISIALALALPDGEWKPLILGATYCVVVFSIIVQGLTVAPLAQRLANSAWLQRDDDPDGHQ
ncbi:monovalent cation:H+ antiporter, CPA1 family [Monaibacterium marinum]|uniref:Monovalent cation:H+ antiporter, CPA1 family n=1 Tax=Pontivivens marinum TaxID=1690039 RepID=A0A2C9CRZ0_9RHOB|nr:sodium:proton antiporter [Monaibacterium marinum]SOH93149.1 monovalent cation:H+ antiporter, CPA1 family [Monaibacterium marinum]